MGDGLKYCVSRMEILVYASIAGFRERESSCGEKNKNKNPCSQNLGFYLHWNDFVRYLFNICHQNKILMTVLRSRCQKAQVRWFPAVILIAGAKSY